LLKNIKNLDIRALLSAYLYACIKLLAKKNEKKSLKKTIVFGKDSKTP
jgi:hypothetical protein